MDRHPHVYQHLRLPAMAHAALTRLLCACRISSSLTSHAWHQSPCSRLPDSSGVKLALPCYHCGSSHLACICAGVSEDLTNEGKGTQFAPL